MRVFDRIREHRRLHSTDVALAFLLVAAAVLCHARYLVTPELLFVTEGDSFRQILPTSVLIQRALAAGDPFWSWQFGLGGDIFTELSYAGTTSVFTYLQYLLSTLFGGVATDLFTALAWKLAMSVIRLTLAMLFTFALLRREGVRPAYAVIGALCYGTAPWFLYRAILFSFMTDCFVLLPLAALAYTNYRRTGRWIPLTVSIALLLSTSLYFGYICCIFLGSMFLVLSCEKGQGARAYWAKIGKLLAISVAGALLAACCLLPAVNGVLSSDRTVMDASLRFLPRLETLYNLFSTLFLGSGMFALPLVGLLVFFIKPKLMESEAKKKTLLAAIWLVLLFIPAVSSMMNGFSYETPRWHFVVVFACALALPSVLDALEWQGGVRTKPVFVWLLCAALTALFIVFCDKTVSAASLAWAAVFGLGVCSIPWTAFRARIEKTRFGSRCWSAALVAMVLVSGVLNSVSVRVHNIYSDNALDMLYGSEAQYAANAALAPENGAFYRAHDMTIDTHAEDAEDRPYLYGAYGISNYASELSGSLSTWHKKTFRFPTTPVCAGIYQSFDDRLFHEIAWDVRYKCGAAGEAYDLPSCWVNISEDGGVPQYECALSTGFELWYDTAMEESDWLQLSVAQRDAMLLQTAALSGTEAARCPAPEANTATSVLDAALSDAAVTGGSWFTDADTGETLLKVEDGATLVWTVAPVSDEGEWLMCFTVDELSGEPLFTMSAGGRSVEKFADVAASESLNYPLSDYAFRFASDETQLSLTLTRGVYRLRDFSVSRTSYADLADWVAARNRYNFDSLHVSGSHIDGMITVDSTGVLALSMPLSAGWTCRVNGINTPLVAVNGIFAGVLLTPGTYSIELHYLPPYLLTGACVTLVTTLGLCACAFCRRRRDAQKPAASPEKAQAK